MTLLEQGLDKMDLQMPFNLNYSLILHPGQCDEQHRKTIDSTEIYGKGNF